MLIRIINTKENSDEMFDCVSSNVREEKDEKGKVVQFNMILIYSNGTDRTRRMNKGDQIYYMNDVGKTIVIDKRKWEN